MNIPDFNRRLAANPRPLVVDFWAPWCMPCRVIEPALKNLEAAYAGQVDVLRLNADESPDLLRLLGVFSIPTLVAYRDGVEVARRTGAASQAVLEGLFRAALSGVQPVAGEHLAAGPTSLDRLVRLTGGISLFGLGLVSLLSLGGSALVSWGLIALGLALGFSGVYDRCPVYRAISGWLKARLM
jgi:thioredoxin 1